VQTNKWSNSICIRASLTELRSAQSIQAYASAAYSRIHSGESGSSLPSTFTPYVAAQRYPHIGPYKHEC